MFFSAVYPIRPQSHWPRNQLAAMAITWLVSCCWSLIEVTVKLVTKYPITVSDTTPVTIGCYGKMCTLLLVGKWSLEVDDSCCEIGCKEMNGPKNLHVIALVVSSFRRRYRFFLFRHSPTAQQVLVKLSKVRLKTETIFLLLATLITHNFCFEGECLCCTWQSFTTSQRVAGVCRQVGLFYANYRWIWQPKQSQPFFKKQSSSNQQETSGVWNYYYYFGRNSTLQVLD